MIISDFVVGIFIGLFLMQIGATIGNGKTRADESFGFYTFGIGFCCFLVNLGFFLVN